MRSLLFSVALLQALDCDAQNSQPMDHQRDYSEMLKDEFIAFLSQTADTVEVTPSTISDYITYRYIYHNAENDLDTIDIERPTIKVNEKCPSKKSIQYDEAIISDIIHGTQQVNHKREWFYLDSPEQVNLSIISAKLRPYEDNEYTYHITEYYRSNFVPLAKKVVMHHKETGTLSVKVFSFEQRPDCFEKELIYSATGQMRSTVVALPQSGQNFAGMELDSLLRQDID